jgi:predicted transport protein
MPVILTDFPQLKSASGKLLSRYTYEREGELQDEVSKHFKEVFGEKVRSFEKTIRLSIPGIDKKAIPDDFALDLSDPQKPMLLLIEYELSIHDVYEHISTQIMKFLNAFKSNRSEVFESLRRSCKTEGEQLKLYEAIFKASPETLIVIDQATEGIKEVADGFGVRLLEFTSYVEDVNSGLKSEHIHIFEPYQLEEEKLRVKKEVPEYRRDWGAQLKWVGPKISGLVNELIGRIEKELPGATHRPMYRWYIFHNSEETNTKTMFLTLILGKKKITASIGVDSKSFKDEKGWARDVKGWFFHRPGCQEKRFGIGSSGDLDYAIKLIKQSYDFSLA